jgi:multidrug resistance efflux pump
MDKALVANSRRAAGRAQASLDRLRPDKELGDALPAMHLVRTSWIVRLIAKLTLAVLSLSIVAMIFVPWQQTARGYGSVSALNPQERPQIVASRQDGIVKTVRPDLRQGSLVQKGEVILEIEPFAPQALSQLSSQIEQIEIKRQAALTAQSLAEQNVELQRLSGESLIASVEKEVEASKQKYEQQLNEVKVLEAEFEQKSYEKNQSEALFPKGLISEQELIAKRNAYNQAYSKLDKGKAQVIETLATFIAKEKELESKSHDVYIKNRQAEQKAQEETQKLAAAEKELTDLEIKLGEMDRLKIASPVDGVIQEIYSIEGANTVKKGDPLFVVVPQSQQLAVELSVAGRDMPLVQLGDKVRLQFQGWPAVQFVGWPSAAVGTFGGKIAAVSPTDNAKGDFYVLVVPDPEEPEWPDNRYLRQGVRANGWILLKQVALGYEIWRQLNGFPPVISEGEPGTGKKDAGPFGQDKGSKKIKLPKS